MSKLISYLQLGGVALIVGQLSYIIVNNQTNITNQNNTTIQNTDGLADNEDTSNIKSLLEEINANLSFVAATMGKKDKAEAEALKKSKEFFSTKEKWNPFAPQK